MRARTADLDRANAALRVEEGRFRSAFDDTDVAMVLTDLDNRFVRANAAFARLFGYTMDEVLQLTMAQITHPDDVAASYAQRARLLAGEAQFFQMEKRYRHRDGRVLWGLTNLSLVRGPAGEPLMYVGQVQDITERRRAEEAVRQRTAELTEANRELAQKNQENELFVYSVSHDLRCPLVNLQGFSKELGKACRRPAGPAGRRPDVPADVRAAARTLLDGKVAKSVGFIQSAVGAAPGRDHRRPAAAVAGRAGRVPAGAGGREPAWSAGSSSPLQGTIAEKRATVGVGRLPPAWGDATALEQVFANLIGNALKYLDPARPGRIEVGGGRPARRRAGSTYYVRDNGLGIPAAYQPKVFQASSGVHPGSGPGEGHGAGDRRPGWSSGTAGGCGSSPTAGVGAARSTSALPAPPAEGGRTSREAPNELVILLAEDDEGHAYLIQQNLRGGGRGEPGRPRAATGRRRWTTSAAEGATPGGCRTARCWSCWTSTCRWWTGSRCSASSRPTRHTDQSRSSC